jgi:hypothetical protein
MKPEYANTFGLRKLSDKDGDILEVTLDISYKYMENTVTITPKGLENIATPAAEPVASIVMSRQSAISLRNLLIQTLGME